MYTGPKMACLDNIYFESRSNSVWLIALGMYLKIKDISHGTALLSRGNIEILYGESQSIPPFLTHSCAFCMYVKRYSQMYLKNTSKTSKPK